MNKILVIGAKGMLGRDLIPELQTAFPESELLGWDIDEIDIRKKRETIEKIESVQPTVLINVAAYTDVDGCELNVQEAFLVNSEGMSHIAQGVRQCGARAIYLSTDYVFDGKKNLPYVEEDSPSPLNTYGHSKLRGEEVTLGLGENGLVIRTQWLYGLYGRNFVTAILQQVREKLKGPEVNRPLSIVDDQIGCPTYTVDLAKAIARLVQMKASGIFHVTNQNACSWYEFGQTILRFLNIKGVEVLPISSSQLNRKATRPLYSVLSSEKLKREIGFQLRPWTEALKDFLNRLRQSGTLDWMMEA